MIARGSTRRSRRAAGTKSRSRSASTCAARDARVADPAVDATARRSRRRAPGCATVATIAMLSRMPGNAIRTSTMRMSTSSTAPPKQPAIVPSVMPIGARDRDDDEADLERRARAVQQLRQRVDAVRVGAEPVRAPTAARSRSSRLPRSGSNGATSGPTSADDDEQREHARAPIQRARRRAAASRRLHRAPDPRVGQAVGEVDQQVDDDVDDGDDEHAALHHAGSCAR